MASAQAAITRHEFDASIRSLDRLRDADQRLADERERFRNELDAAHAKALQVKDIGDTRVAEALARALDLARGHQDYRDKQANELREQINSERHLYATKEETEVSRLRLAGELKVHMDTVQALLHPLIEFVNEQRGKRLGADEVGDQITAKTLAKMQTRALLISVAGLFIGPAVGVVIAVFV